MFYEFMIQLYLMLKNSLGSMLGVVLIKILLDEHL